MLKLGATVRRTKIAVALYGFAMILTAGVVVSPAEARHWAHHRHFSSYPHFSHHQRHARFGRRMHAPLEPGMALMVGKMWMGREMTMMRPMTRFGRRRAEASDQNDSETI
jgi:hypothetical protein